MRMTLHQAGSLSTLQDLGRTGYRGVGVGVGGAADEVALRIANLVVGNPETAAAIECTLGGPEVSFSADALVAIGGASCRGLAAWTPQRVAKGEILKLGWMVDGCRTYLAVRGGFDVPRVLGSRATDLGARFGGFEGRALRAGDSLSIGRAPPGAGRAWQRNRELVRDPEAPVALRVVRGAQAAEFGDHWRDVEFAVSPQSGRMGVRLSGRSLERRSRGELPSAPVVPGTIQVPPDGNPIVLLADAQTLGGYPQLAHVISVDLPPAAQLRPGDRVRFTEVAVAEARRLLRRREELLDEVRRCLSST